MSERNPCSYKAQCKNCKIAASTSRPHFCIELQCEAYTPCKKCSKNRKLILGLCEHCAGLQDEQYEAPLTEPQPITSTRPELRSGDSEDAMPREEIDRSIVIPGTPPNSLSTAARNYYIASWSEYSGYYREPTARMTVHQIIITEILTQQITTRLMNASGDARDALQKQLSGLIKTLGELKDQLPAKEANQASDDDKALGAIYERYLKERGAIRHGGITRVFEDSTIALAPVLPFKVDLQEILLRLGYSVVDVDQAMQKLCASGDLPSDPIAIAKFFAFPIDQQLALDSSSGGMADINVGQDEADILSENDLNEEYIDEPE